MTTRILSVLVSIGALLLPVILLVTGSAPLQSDPNSDSSNSRMATPLADVKAALATSISSFTVDMHMALTEASPESNIFYSPLSVVTALGMTLMGSAGNTKEQLSAVLRTSQYDNQQLQEAFAAILNKYINAGASDGVELNLANLMYSSNQLQMRPEFVESLTTHFHAVAKTVDFGGQTEAVRNEINSVVEQKTNNKIKDLIPTGVLNGLTRLVLINAIYFKGLWSKQFKEANTKDAPFYVSEGNTVQVPMMNINDNFRLMVRKDLEARVLSMDYKSGNLSMVIILPDKKDGLRDVERKLASVNLQEVGQKGHSAKIELQMPRFKMEYSQDLVPLLKQLGAGDLVTAGASDLSGIGGPPGDLYVSNVLHKAFIEVNEAGTEAAAATVVTIMATSIFKPQPVKFVVDRPFMFILMDGEYCLFAGRVTNPSLLEHH